MADTLRDSSRKCWNSTGSLEHINAGSFQRIADACEKMAMNYLTLQTEVDRLRREVEYQATCVRNRDLTISAMRGVITKLKKEPKP